MRRGIREDDKARLWSYSPPVVTRSPPVQGQPAPSHVLVKQVSVYHAVYVHACDACVCVCAVGGWGRDKSEGFSREIGRLSQEETVLHTLSLHSECVARGLFITVGQYSLFSPSSSLRL